MADGHHFPHRHANRSLDRLRRQIVHASMYSPLWRAWMSHGGAVPFIASTEDFEKLPIVELAMLRRVSPWALVPAGQRTALAKAFPSPGPDGSPTWSFWSPSDWRCMVKTLAEALAPHRPPGADLIAYNAHPDGLISGGAYGDALRLLDVAVAPRFCDGSRPTEVAHEVASLGCNVLVMGHGDRSPETDAGASFDKLMAERPSLFEQLGIKWWICTSIVPSRGHMDAARRQGVQSITRMYGSSEVGLFAVACPHGLRDYHVTSGHVHVEVVDERGACVGGGDRGRVVVTRFGGMTADGSFTVNEGSQLIRLAIGDVATWIDEPCSCGSMMPRLRDVRRELGKPRSSNATIYLRDEAARSHGSPVGGGPEPGRVMAEADEGESEPPATRLLPVVIADGGAARSPKTPVRVVSRRAPLPMGPTPVSRDLAGTETTPYGNPIPVRTGYTQVIVLD